MTETNKEFLEEEFNFLVSTFNFELQETKSYDHALYGKFLSDSVGIYFIFEFRDSIPQVQFSKLKNKELEVRPGLYTLRELYKNENFKLKTFYLDEILSFEKEIVYKDYFEGVTTIEEAIKICARLTKKYAEKFIVGEEKSYTKMNSWFKAQVQW